MLIDRKNIQSVSFNHATSQVEIIDQRSLPFRLEWISLSKIDEVTTSICNMSVRGAPAIGVLAAFGVYLAVQEYGVNTPAFNEACHRLKNARPTAINLAKGVNIVMNAIKEQSQTEAATKMALDTAIAFMESEIDSCKRIGENGLTLIKKIHEQTQKPVNILTHCNAGWLACVDWGTALAPIFMAHLQSIPLHVWVDETRPRNQGARLTAWELHQAGIPFTVIPDNSGGLLMQEGNVDMVITGADRITLNGDTANKTGTYLKALAAKDNDVPFYIAAPSSTFDFDTEKGVGVIPIEQRHRGEVAEMEGISPSGEIILVKIFPNEFPAMNHAFDITPARLITAIITEKGIFNANKNEISRLL
ncbi:MAG: S-methyl-5-thioribose-1-phosphate isomerase [Bacteroidetes bacterium HGW-Bacteroidetes-21]|jgi:methylthioribose-1-phosphate isomerase|nr:MAG: S-methyl-5-thioribose-1-phosphate isomerase [Bacteroidetes bacterium HGW-Bacteroidetes-21]